MAGLIGILMVVVVFVGMFILAWGSVGFKSAVFAFSTAIFIAVWIVIASSLIKYGLVYG